MKRFYLDSQTDLFGWDWKNEVVAFDENKEFDETFVLLGNRWFTEIATATWYDKAKTVLDALDFDYNVGECFADRGFDYLTREQKKALIQLYHRCTRTDDINTIVEALNIIYPEREYETTTIRGYSQSDWQEVIYAKADKELVEKLEAWYFGNITEIGLSESEDNEEIGEIDVWDTIENDKLWKIQREGKLKEYLLTSFGYNEDEECEIYEADGYIQRTKWKKIA